MPRHFSFRAGRAAALCGLVAFGSVAAAGFLAAPVSAHDSPLPEGILAQAPGDPRVYFIQDGQKRWVVSEQAFLTQGFRWSDIAVVEPQQLAASPEGAAITHETFLGLAVDPLLLPDLVPVAPYDIRFAVEEGRTRLRFTATFWNRGTGALELRTPAAAASGADETFDASQRLFRADGSFVDRPVGTLFWHDIHDHYHYDDFGEYVLKLIRPAEAGAVDGQAVTQKTTFCMRDDQTIDAPADAPRQPRTYSGCRGNAQGVSVGWADVYPSTLPDQYFDVTGFPAGVYALSFTVDPHGAFAERHHDNNTSTTLVELNPAARTVRVLASASAYVTPGNQFPDGMLIRAEGDPRVYVLHRNAKRWIRNERVFASYGYADGDIYVLPAGAVAAIPNARLVRSEAGAVYVLNDAGYRRRILAPDVLASYGWTVGHAPVVNEEELASYPPSDLILPDGTDRVYDVGLKRFVGTLGSLPSLGLNPAAVHVVNETDFLSYAASVIVTGLDVPWAVAFLPDGDMLVTERPGTLRRLGTQPAAFPVPAVAEAGEGGLMGIALHPDFATNRQVYLYYTTANPSRNRVTRFVLEDDRLAFDRVILDDIPSALYHDGGGIAFGPDGMLYLTTGDASNANAAQNLSSLAGKTLRLTPDGGIPADNPFGTAVWSYGHRNAQGLAWDAQGRLWQTEHGRTGASTGFDELNLVEKGGNYGWPTIQGDQTRAGMVAPVRQSGASVTWAPSGIAFADGTLFFAGLFGQSLYAADVGEDGSVTNFRQYFRGTHGRLRAVTVGPDGFLYVTTSNRDDRGTARAGDDKILRIAPDFLK